MKSKEFATYDAFTKSTAVYPTVQSRREVIEAMYCALGLGGEAGEVLEKVKKWHRDGKLDHEQVAFELGDVLYYLTRLANTLGYTLEQIMLMNVGKLSLRKEKGTLQGSGDNR